LESLEDVSDAETALGFEHSRAALGVQLVRRQHDRHDDVPPVEERPPPLDARILVAEDLPSKPAKVFGAHPVGPTYGKALKPTIVIALAFAVFQT
jgi:hypothetical protein